MTTRYCGPGGSDANSGLTYALRKLTLNGLEDTPVAAGDVCYIAPGTYRELLTVDVAGTAGNAIAYIGDYLGTNTDGVGGVVRITGSDNDQTQTRAQCVNAPSARSYRTFRGFTLDMTTGALMNIQASSQNWIVEQCVFGPNSNATGILLFAGTGSGHIVRQCLFHPGKIAQLWFTHSVVVDNAAHLVENCIFLSNANAQGIRIDRVGGWDIKNCVFLGCSTGIQITTALTVGQVVNSNNCIFYGCGTGVRSTTATELTENYNTFFSNNTDRNTTGVGANSVAYPPLFDSRWFFQLVFAGAGPSSALQLISPFDLASYSQLVDLAGTSPPTLDMRGTAVQGAEREWGPLEYDSTLKITGASSGGGGNANLLTGKL